MPLGPRSTRLMVAVRSDSWSGNLPCSALKEACASASLRCEESCTAYPPDASDCTAVARGAGGCKLWVVAGGAAATRSRSRGAGGDVDGSCGSSEIGARDAAFGAGACFGGVAAGGGLPADRLGGSAPSGLIVTVRTRLASGLLPLFAFAPLPPADDGNPPDCDACGDIGRARDGVLISTGSSSRETTRSGGATSRTRS